MNAENTEGACCLPFKPESWNDREFHWENKRFVKRSILTLFYVPLNFGKVMQSLDHRLHEHGVDVQEGLCLSDHTSRWNMDVYLAVNKEVPGEENVFFSGSFFSKVYEGSFSDTGNWVAEYKKEADKRGYIIKQWFMWYTTCPRCSKKYGKNYVAIVSRVERH